MKIRKYTPSDRAACIEIFHGNYPKYFDQSELKYLHTWLDGHDTGKTAYSNASEDRYFVLTKKDEVIASGGFYIQKAKPEAVISWGMVAREFHKKGFGKKLLEFRLATIQEQFPNHSIRLDTSQHTFGFFEKLGFVIEKITADAYGPGLDKYDMILKK